MLKKSLLAAFVLVTFAAAPAYAQLTAGKVPPSDVILMQLVEDIRASKDDEHRRLLQEAYDFARKGEYNHPVLKAYLDTRMAESQVSAILHRLQALALGFTEYVMDTRKPPRHLGQLVNSDGSPNWRGPYVPPEFLQPKEGAYYGVSLLYLQRPEGTAPANLDNRCAEKTCLAMLTFEAVEIDTVIALREELQRHKADVHFIENPVKNTTMVDMHYPLGLVPSP